MCVSVTIHRTDLLDTGGSAAAGWAIIGLCLASSLVIIALTPPPIGEQSIVMSMSVCVCVCVCLSVRIHILRTTCPIFIFFVHVTCGCGSVLL